MRRRILVIEDDEGIGSVLERGLELAGYDVTVAATARSGRAAWRTGGFDLILLDLMLPDGNGLDLLDECRATGDTTPVVLLTAREPLNAAEQTRSDTADARLMKPFDYAELVACVDRHATRRGDARAGAR
jgi:two-component system, OmpR family, response regulator QseB